MLGLSIIYLNSFVVSTRYTLWSKVPSYTLIGSVNCANEVPPISLTLDDVISSGIEKRYVVPWELPTQTSPERRVKNLGVLSSVVPKFISPMVIVAVAAVFERGTYPIFLAKDITFSRIVAESKNDSFATKFALNALM